jgi:hypothetical protein
LNLDKEYLSLIKHVSENIVTKSKQSLVIAEELRKLNIKLNKKNVTRWNSILFMIRSALKLSPDDFKKIKNEMPTRNAKEREVRDKFHLKSNERAMLEELKEILEAFEFITNELQSNLVNISRVYPGITFLKEKLSINNSVYTTDLREALLASLTKRFEKLLDDDLIVFSTLLDPNFGLDYFEADKQDVVKARLLQKLKRQQLQNQVKK